MNLPCVSSAVRSGAARFGRRSVPLRFALLAALWSPEIAGANSVTRGPYLQLATPTSVVVRWRTAQPASSRVVWEDENTSLWFTSSDSAITTEHEVLLSGLTPGGRCWYAVGDMETMFAGDETQTFVAPPPVGTAQPVRVWVVGDSGEPGPVQVAVRDAFLNYTAARGADLWLTLGDNAYSSGTDAQYQSGLFVPYALLLRQSVVWPTRGNHDDLHAGPNNDYYDFFTLPALGQAGGVPSGTEAYYSFDHANVHFVCLDSEGSSRQPNGAMLTWLRADLAATDQDWIIAYWHHPPYSKGSHDSDSEGTLIEMRENALPVLDSLGADLVLAGHSHSYERSFLLRQHYGRSNTLASFMKVDVGDGRRGGDGAYQKPTPQQAPFEGAVYVVAGSSSKTSGGSLNHPVMISSQNVPGSLVLDVNGWELDARFLNSAGAVTDSFSILKGAVVSTPDSPAPGGGFGALRAWPRPSNGGVELSFRLPRAGRVQVTLYDSEGRRIAVLAEGEEAAGERRVRWDGRDAAGGRVPAGVYFAVVEFGGERRATRVVLTP